MSPFVKFSDSTSALSDPKPYRLGNHFSRVNVGERNRIEIRTLGSPVALLREFVETWSPPYTLLYILVTPQNEQRDGRYQFEPFESFDTFDDFLIEYWDFFEQDGRHHIWVFAPESDALVVYDRHEILYVYGDEKNVLSKLRQKDFDEREIKIPVPHAHHYSHSFYDVSCALFESRRWIWSEPQEGDQD